METEAVTWRGTRVLVTGAGGFIGSHLTEKLVVLGANTRALVHYRSDGSWGWLDHSPYKDEIEVIAGDVRDRDIMDQAAQGQEIVFHLAALIGIPYSYRATVSYLHTNIEGTLNVLQAVRQAGVRCLVHTSTSEVYGTARYIPIDENHALQGQSPYSASKIAGDKMAEAFNLSYGLPVTTIRPFNTFGPRQSARAVIPTIITQALTESSMQLGNLVATRDFNYVEDLVEAFLRISLCPKAIGQVINIGTGREVSIAEVTKLILELVNRPDMPVVCDAARVRPNNSEVERLCADNRKARDIIGWIPQYSLEDGLVRTIDWIRDNLERYRTGVYVI